MDEFAVIEFLRCHGVHISFLDICPLMREMGQESCVRMTVFTNSGQWADAERLLVT